jgi:hypothetical protein
MKFPWYLLFLAIAFAIVIIGPMVVLSVHH